MKITSTKIPGVAMLELEPHTDDRGFFARAHCPEELASVGIEFTVAQINISRNTEAFTLRGMHWQVPPYAEAKIVRCTAGKIFDVAIDLRPHSPTFQSWTGYELSARDGNALLIPEGCAHGFLTLQENSDVLYLMARSYVPGHARGCRYDDSAFAISWPATPKSISAADLAWPAWADCGTRN